ncbi:hypothetical protein ACFLTH_17460 [Bacteroidota bacterium]
MKKIFLLIPFIFFACQDIPTEVSDNTSNNNSIESPLQSITPPSDDDDYDGICGNNQFPHINKPADTWNWDDPDGDYHSQLTNLQIANLWSHYGSPESSVVNGELTGHTELKAADLRVIQSNYPTFRWDFVYCHKYSIERKIGSNGTFEAIGGSPINNKLYVHSPPAQTSYYDTQIDLSKPHTDIYYRVRTMNYSSYCGENDIISFPSNLLTSSISGPNLIKVPEDGRVFKLFTSNITNSVGTLKYRWYWNGRLVGTGNSYGKVFVDRGGSYESAQLKLVVTDDHGSSTSTMNVEIYFYPYI